MKPGTAHRTSPAAAPSPADPRDRGESVAWTVAALRMAHSAAQRLFLAVAAGLWTPPRPCFSLSRRRTALTGTPRRGIAATDDPRRAAAGVGAIPAMGRPATTGKDRS